jgi:hypothetical protein
MEPLLVMSMPPADRHHLFLDQLLRAPRDFSTETS